MTNQQKLKQLYSILSEAEVYQRSMGKLNFDMMCCAPEEGLTQAGEDISVLGRQLHKLTHSKKYQRLVCELHEDSEGLTDVQRRLVERLWEDHMRTKNFTPAFAFELDSARNKAYGAWLAAKKNSDFSLFRDSLAAVIDCTRRAIDLRDEKPSTYYNACLDDNEKGGSEDQLDAFFEIGRASCRERV